MAPQSRIFYFEEAQEVSIPCESDMASRKRKISFRFEKNETFQIPHIKDMSPEEIQDVWYQRMDYERMKTSFIPIIRKMMQGEIIEESNQQTARGLEFRTRKGAVRRQHNKLEAMTAVLEEQEHQKINNCVNDELLAELYISCSAHCIDAARRLGFQDEAAVQYIIHQQNYDTFESTESYSDDSSEISTTHCSPRKNGILKMFQHVRLSPKRVDQLDSIPVRQQTVVGSAA